ncbi:MAG: PD-(D/E)XK nuclease domain-containing protein, partial [Tannerella sp.]|nr:PD-(D/E)XK nuclease domain-containing protein [Tannerella sp.]
VQKDMICQIKELDSEGFNRSLKAMIAYVPSILHIAEEKYYHSLFMIWLYSLGFRIESELLTNVGRIDAVWRMKDTIVIAELKHDREAPLERLLSEAEAQINDKKYYERYIVEGKRLILLAVAFSGKEAGSRIM